MTQEQLIYRKAAQLLDLPETFVKEVYVAYWREIRNFIEKDKILNDMSEEEFTKVKRNVNLANLGKLSCTYQHFLRKINNIKKRTEYYENKKNETVA